MRNLITGGTGFIGARLARLLAERGEEVVVFGLPAPRNPLLDHHRINVLHGDLLSLRDIAAALKGCERVYHLAAYARNWASDPVVFYRVNVLGTENVLQAALAAGAGKVICTSSNVTFGPSNGCPVNEQTKRTREFFTDYERSKVLAEHVARKYCLRGLPVVIVNPTRVFGPGTMSESNSVTKMIWLYLQGKWRFLPGDGNGVGNYVFVDNLIDGFVRAMDRGRSGENYILGGTNLSFIEFFSVISDLANKKVRLFCLHPNIALMFAAFEELRARWFRSHPVITPGWMKTFLADWEYSSEKARNELGYVITPFPTAVRATIDWIESGMSLGARA